MPQHLICPGCRSPLVIRDGSPAQLTCPRCLASIRNPHPLAARPVPDAAAHPTTPIPLPYHAPTAADHEALSDHLGTVVSIAILVVCLAAGAFLNFTNGRADFGTLFLFAAILSALVPIHYFNQRRQGLDPSIATDAGFHLIRVCAAIVIAVVCVLALLMGACALVVGGAMGFHH